MKFLKRLKGFLLSNLYFSFKKRIINHTLLIPVSKGICVCSINPFKRYSPNYMDNIFKEYYSEDTLLIDIGSNIGQTLIKWIGIGGKASKYVGFDPNPNCYSYLYDLLTINKLENSKIICSGLSSKTSLSSFKLSNRYDPRASSINGYRHNNENDFQLFLVLLDANYCFEKLDLDYKKVIIKIDAEGNEYDILFSLKNFINNFNPVIIVEILREKDFLNLETNLIRKGKLEKISNFLEDNNYEMSRIIIHGMVNDQYSKLTDDYLCLPKK